MKVQLDAELVMELRADCPEEDRLVVGGNDWGFLKVIQIKGGYFDGEKLRGRVVPGGADWNMGVGGDTEESVHSRTVFAKYLLQTRPSFHAPRGKYEWLNYGVYVGSLSGSTENGVRGVNIKIYKMM